MTDRELLKHLSLRFRFLAGPADSPDPGLPTESYRMLLRSWADEVDRHVREAPVLPVARVPAPTLAPNPCPVISTDPDRIDVDRDFHDRARRVVRVLGAQTWTDLAHHTEADIQSMGGVGRSTVQQIRQALAQRGLSLRDGSDPNSAPVAAAAVPGGAVELTPEPITVPTTESESESEPEPEPDSEPVPEPAWIAAGWLPAEEQ